MGKMRNEKDMQKTDPYKTVRIWPKTWELLRIIAAHTGRSIVRVLHDFAVAEHERVMVEETKRQKGKAK